MSCIFSFKPYKLTGTVTRTRLVSLMKTSGECSSWPFQYPTLSLFPLLTPFTASLTASRRFAQIGQSPRRRAVFYTRLCLIRSSEPFSCINLRNDEYEVTWGCGTPKRLKGRWARQVDPARRCATF